MVINKSTPLYRRQLKTAPAHPLGDRVFVRPAPAEKESLGGIVVPDEALKRNFSGTLLAVGDGAADKLYDYGVLIGDQVWYGKYAGLIEQWDHIVGPDNPKCAHDGAWDVVTRDDARWLALHRPDHDTKMHACRSCGTLRASERVVIISADDLVCDVDLQARLETGEMRRLRGKDADGKPRYYIENVMSYADSFEYDVKIATKAA